MGCLAGWSVEKPGQKALSGLTLACRRPPPASGAPQEFMQPPHRRWEGVRGISLGQRLPGNRKDKGTRACRQSREWREDAQTTARRDPRDLAQARRPAVQSHAVHGGPLATASASQVDASPGQADGLRDLCESSTAQGVRGRDAWTASLTRGRAV